MPIFSANLSMLFTEVPFLDRFYESAKAGFKYVEFQFPYDYEPEAIKLKLDAGNQEAVLFNLPAGDSKAGDRGIAANPNRVAEFRVGVDRALHYAEVLGVKQLNCLVGTELEGVLLADQHKIMVENIAYAGEKLAAEGLTLLLEAINTYDVPGFLLSTSRGGLSIIEKVNKENIKIQYDVYHMQKMEGNLIETIKSNLDYIGHIQIADNPGRHQPGTGEINFPFVLESLDRLGYEGFVGLEYIPSGDTVKSLSSLKSFGFSL